MWRQTLYHKRGKEMSRKSFGMRETMERASINCKKDRSISFMTPFQFGLETFRHSVTEKKVKKKGNEHLKAHRTTLLEKIEWLNLGGEPNVRDMDQINRSN